tara:strand:+ start:952 stop:2271 length:1320 start_codon:yes stop_codon:yes gene_type:complete
MTDIFFGISIFIFLFALLALRIPIGVSLIVCGILGIAALSGIDTVLSQMKTAAFFRFSTYELSVIPLFLLMGQFSLLAGISSNLFEACNTWFGHKKGGLAIATIGACAGFGSITGSSLATASTMAEIALPEMKKYNYSNALSTGTLAAGGTLGILIPPSIALVIYSILAEQNITAMFTAALVRGLLAALGYIIAINIYVKIFPKSAPTGKQADLASKIISLKKVWPIIFIFLIVLGGIYFGIFTPTEAAAVGAFLSGIIAWKFQKLNWSSLKDSILKTAETTGMIFLILFGADIFNSFLGRTMLPQELLSILTSLELGSFTILLIILLIYIFLGFFMDSLSMIILTIPIFFPIISTFDFGLNPSETGIWFGIIVLIVVEVGLITPPIGLNVFVINSIAKNVPMSQTFIGTIPFLITDLIRITALLFFPGITLFLVRLLN